MAFTRDFDITAPLNHTLNNRWPENDRNTKQDLQDRLADILGGFNSGESVKGVIDLPFIAQSADPSTIADQIQLYGKAVDGKTELFTKNEDGTVNQITKAGALNIPELTKAIVNNLAYPVGSVVTFGVSTNPGDSSMLGVGTWVAISGKVIVGIDAGQTEFDTLNETGGEKTHTLTTDEIPSHDHILDLGANIGTGGKALDTYGTGATPTQNTRSTGGGLAHNNLQPYIVKYVWERTA